MQIHTVKSGETIYDIAKAYDVSPSKTIENNGLDNKNKLSVGRELVIIRPTRTYTVKRGDTLSGIAMRFGVKLADLITANPSHIGNDKLDIGEILTIKTEKKKYGSSVSNGYFYNGCTKERLISTLPFLTYVTVASVISDNSGLRKIFNDAETIKVIKENGKIPLMRIYEMGGDAKYLNKNMMSEYIEKILNLAKNSGYSGVVLSAFGIMDKNPEGFAEFVMELRKRMIGCDLILFTEIDDSAPPSACDLADGSIYIYDKLMLDEIPSFENGEERLMKDFATKCESSKVFIDIPSLAYDCGKYLSYTDAMALCYKKGGEISTDPETLISEFNYKDGQKCRAVKFESMENIKAKLEAISELGFMGISFDIMRTPKSTLMIYSTLYKILCQKVCYFDI